MVIFEQITPIEHLLGRHDLPLRSLPSDLRPVFFRKLSGIFYLLKLVKRA